MPAVCHLVDPKTETSTPPLPLPAQCIAPLRWQRMRTARLRARALATGRPWYDDPDVIEAVSRLDLLLRQPARLERPQEAVERPD